MTFYQLINSTIQSQIDNLKHESALAEQTVNILQHYTPKTVQESMQRIIDGNPEYQFDYKIGVNDLTIIITRK